MKILRKIFVPVIALLLALVMVFSVACKTDSGKGNDSAPSTNDGQTGNEGNGGNSGDSGNGNGNTEGGGSGNGNGNTEGGGSGNTEGGGNQNQPSAPVAVTYTVTFNYNNGSGQSVNVNVNENAAVTPPLQPSYTGHQFTGWYEDAACRTKYDMTKPVTSNLTLYAGWATLDAIIKGSGAYNESAYICWQDGTPSAAKVEYRVEGSSNPWREVPKELYREVDGNARADIIGLNPANEYEIKITTSGGHEATLPAAVSVSAYDRSGYAHFKYSDGVGAYNDDGTLKDGALVIYVTDDNKNDVTDSAYKYNATDGTYEKQDITSYITATQAFGGGTAGVQKGIGEILNNRRYNMAGGDRWNVGIAKLTRVYGAVAVRIVGTVKNECTYTAGSKCSINGLTDYDSTLNGGSEGDNGAMARMVNAKNLTIEGVGEDSVVDGWGFHFIHTKEESGQPAGTGTSFEVRNLTFQNYPEDAVGMEGEEEEGTLTLHTPVERCWVHNNTFLPGSCPTPAGGESDKKEGDGSCDFKRGLYFTCSYNYFENCHKTNLLGSGGTSLQYCVTYHHNWWNGCASRQPLARRANIHFYNNYVSGTTDTVSSLRANCYMFSEANYFYASKNVVSTKAESGGAGAAKSYNDVLLGTYEDYGATVVTDRETTVDNNCEYAKGSVSYKTFDTNPNLFYYDAANKKTDALLDTALGARVNCITKSGANGHGDGKETKFIYGENVPSSSVQLNDEGETVIDIASAKANSTVKGVLFKYDGKNSSVKFKGIGLIFKLDTPAEVKINASAGDETKYPELVKDDGEVIKTKFSGEITVNLEPGIYFIESGIPEGNSQCESELFSLSFTAAAGASERRIQAAVAAIEAIPAEVTLAAQSTVAAAREAYDALRPEEKTAFASDHSDLVTKLTNAERTINTLLAANVDSLIDAIGSPITADSYTAIQAARAAYDALPSAAKELVTKLSALTAAEAQYASIAVSSINSKIETFLGKTSGDLDSETKDTLLGYKAEAAEIETLYASLTPEQQGQVLRYTEIEAATKKVDQALCWYTFTEKLEELDASSITAQDGDKVAALTAAYNALSGEQKQKAADGTEKTKYDAILAAYDDVKPKIVESYFDGGKADSGDGVIKAQGGEKSTGVTINGVSHKGMKFESESGVLLITVSSKVKLTLYVDVAGKRLYYDNTAELAHPGKNSTGTVATSGSAANAYGLYEIVFEELNAGTYRFFKGDTMNLYYAKVEYLPSA